MALLFSIQQKVHTAGEIYRLIAPVVCLYRSSCLYFPLFCLYKHPWSLSSSIIHRYTTAAAAASLFGYIIFLFFAFFALCAGHWYILFKRTQYIARKMYCRYRTDPLRIIASSVHHYTFFLLLFYDSVAVAEECLVVALLICLLVFVAVSVGTTNKNRQ